ncbi:MAG: UDP-3-O-acyl-N-acetylglucosamine deacetylase [Rhodomicrobiaceae bacterium]
MKTHSGGWQTTIDRDLVLSGTGVHSGADVSIILHPAEADTGWTFIVDNGAGRIGRIPADFRMVSNVTLCTVLSDGNGATVATVEHLLSALRGMNIDNVEIEIEGAEVPVMDGSASAWVDAIDEAGVRVLDEPRRWIKVLKPVRIESGECSAELRPYNGSRYDVTIDFETPLIGRQHLAIDLTPHVYRSEIARARTFGFMKDVKALWAAGRALGSSLENTVALGDDRILNPEGLRFKDEFVRHKTLDAIGDLALAGAPILGEYRSVRGGHRINTMMLEALYKDRTAWAVVEAEHSYVPSRGYASAGLGLAQPFFAADKG